MVVGVAFAGAGAGGVLAGVGAIFGGGNGGGVETGGGGIGGGDVGVTTGDSLLFVVVLFWGEAPVVGVCQELLVFFFFFHCCSLMMLPLWLCFCVLVVSIDN